MDGDLAAAGQTEDRRCDRRHASLLAERTQILAIISMAVWLEGGGREPRSLLNRHKIYSVCHGSPATSAEIEGGTASSVSAD
jgi:hypothetical protein